MTRLQVGVRGVIAIAMRSGGRRPVAECARCGRVRPIAYRGLCHGCENHCRKDGTIGDYGYTRADRLADYVELPRDLTARQAAERLGVSARTIERYKRELAGRQP